MLERARLVDDDAAGWAHVSGWAQLSGRRRTLSCVVCCGEEAAALANWLPWLSDALTECGYPFEVLLVDRGRCVDTGQVVRRWSELPGFRRLAGGPQAAQDGGLEAGIVASRGEGVLVVDPLAMSLVRHLPQMVASWDAGAVLVHARLGGETLAWSAWDEATWAARRAAGTAGLPPEALALGLLDRRYLDWLGDGIAR